jgi:formaldehyde-activating enzyme involved in methanogenesis
MLRRADLGPALSVAHSSHLLQIVVTAAASSGAHSELSAQPRNGVSTMKALILPALFTLSACGTPPVRIALPPVELTTCADEPATPDIPAYEWGKIKAAALAKGSAQAAVDEAVRLAIEVTGIRDQKVLDYVLAERSAYGDCKSKVAGIKAWRDSVE